MQIGFNFTLGDSLPLVQQLIAAKEIDYCELLIDNFLHVPSAELIDAFDCPLGFHIMLSKFLESDTTFLKQLAKRLKTLIVDLKPLYVSDHLAYFSHQGRQLYHLAELDYQRDKQRIFIGVERWQDQLGHKIYLENFPSIMDDGHQAPFFFDELIHTTGAGLLFDASNAICAYRNCGAILENWLPVIATTPHFHVGGYSHAIIDTQVTLDSHDSALENDTLTFLQRHQSQFDKPGATLTYERDTNLDYDAIVTDLRALRAIFAMPIEQVS